MLFSKNQWWGYIHENGSIQVKRYSEQWGKEEIKDAKQSPFVKAVADKPFEASSREEAVDYVFKLFIEDLREFYERRKKF